MANKYLGYALGTRSLGLDLLGDMFGSGPGGASLEDLNARDAVNPAVPLENLAQRVEDQADQRNPVFEQALAQALRERGQASVEQTEQATGITGAAQVQQSLAQFLQSQGQAAAAAQAQRVEQERALLGLQAQLLGQAGQLREQRFETNQRHQEFLMQLKAQQDATPGMGERFLGMAAGAAAAVATGGASTAVTAGAGLAAGGATSAMAGAAPPQIIQPGAPVVQPGPISPWADPYGSIGLGGNPYYGRY